MKNNIILVTGGTGLLGSHLLFNLVQQNREVRAMIRDETKIELVRKVFSYYSDQPDQLIKEIDWVSGDMLDLYSLNEAFSGVERVYHCAAQVAIGGKNGDELIDANVTGTENIVNLCINHQVEKLCHVSSIAALGSALNGELIDENTSWTSSKNRSAYSVSKFKSEMVVWRGIQEGLNAVMVNPSVILGPGFWHTGSGSLFRKAAKGMKYFTKGITGFVDVRDVASAMVALMDSNISGERFIINSDNLTYKELFQEIASEMNVQKPTKEATKSMLQAAIVLDSLANAIGIKKKEITKDVARASFSKSKYSNNKIKETLGLSFLPIKECISHTAGKFKEEFTMS